MADSPVSTGLWADEPTRNDLLAFDAVALTVADAILDDALDPLAIGVSGSWGSGKTTILRLIEADLEARSLPDDGQQVVQTDPWRYEPSVGAKETLIGEILAALTAALPADPAAVSKAKSLLTKLKGRVNWSKAMQVAARASLTFQLPSIDDLTNLINTDGGGDAPEPTTRGLEEFRAEFAELMVSDELSHLKRVVVLVDDLDRCLYPTVVETLETIRLFLAVPKIAFVIAGRRAAGGRCPPRAIPQPTKRGRREATRR